MEFCRFTSVLMDFVFLKFAAAVIVVLYFESKVLTAAEVVSVIGNMHDAFVKYSHVALIWKEWKFV